MARPTLLDLFNRARRYLDTDDLNFPSDLLNDLLRRLWFQAVTMEREWRFFQRTGTATVLAGQQLVPFTFDTLPVATDATRLMTVQWNYKPLTWREASMLIREYGGELGEPEWFTELNEGLQRNIALYPSPSLDGTVQVTFYAEPVYPTDVAPVDSPYSFGFVDLPAEFDDALTEGLLGEMYMREEDPDLYDMHRSTFLEQMGSIRNRWRESHFTPMVMAGRARRPGHDPGGFAANGAFTQPVAPG